jgi:hypothetical protein
MENTPFLLLVRDYHNLKGMNWLQDRSHKVVRIEGLTQESVAYMDAPGIPEQSHHDLRGVHVDELTCHLWSINMGRKPKFALRVIIKNQDSSPVRGNLHRNFLRLATPPTVHNFAGTDLLTA